MGWLCSQCEREGIQRGHFACSTNRCPICGEVGCYLSPDGPCPNVEEEDGEPDDGCAKEDLFLALFGSPGTYAEPSRTCEECGREFHPLTGAEGHAATHCEECWLKWVATLPPAETED